MRFSEMLVQLFFNIGCFTRLNNCPLIFTIMSKWHISILEICTKKQGRVMTVLCFPTLSSGSSRKNGLYAVFSKDLATKVWAGSKHCAYDSA